MPKTFLSPAGVKKLEDELKRRKEETRKEIALRIEEAKELGDLSENSEYQTAREDQSMNEMRIAEVEKVLKEAVVIDDRHKRSDKVCVGSTVVVEIDGKEFTYTINGSREADPANGSVSNESPIGQALLDAKAGDVVEYDTPEGPVKCKVIKLK